MTRRRPRLRGFVLAETLVASSIAALAIGLITNIAVWSVREIGRAQALSGAISVGERVYEEARVTSAAELAVAREGEMGRYAWSRTPVAGGPNASIQKLRIDVRWRAKAGEREQVFSVDAAVAPVFLDAPQ